MSDNEVYVVSWRQSFDSELIRQFFDDRDEAIDFLLELRDVDRVFYLDLSVV